MGQGARSRRIWDRVAGSRSPLISAELVIFGGWGVLAPYVAGPLDLTVDTRALVESLGEVLPAAAVVCAAVLSLLAGRRWFAASVLVAAAGALMTATHASLLVQAGRGEQDMTAALFYAVPGVVILVLGGIAASIDGVGATGRSAATDLIPRGVDT